MNYSQLKTIRKIAFIELGFIGIILMIILSGIFILPKDTATIQSLGFLLAIFLIAQSITHMALLYFAIKKIDTNV